MKKVMKWFGVGLIGIFAIALLSPTQDTGMETVVETQNTSVVETVKESLWDIQAQAKAESYLRSMSFSRTGLIEQLEFEGFDKNDATNAVDSLNVNWNEQAVKKAESYLNSMSFSKSGLIEQLEFEGFTPEQARYGVSRIGG
jgi:hypothetical protein